MWRMMVLGAHQLKQLTVSAVRCFNGSCRHLKKKSPKQGKTTEEKGRISRLIAYRKDSLLFGPLAGKTDRRSIRKSQSKLWLEAIDIEVTGLAIVCLLLYWIMIQSRNLNVYARGLYLQCFCYQWKLITVAEKWPKWSIAGISVVLSKLKVQHICNSWDSNKSVTKLNCSLWLA